MRYYKLSEAEQNELAIKAKSGDKQAKQKLFESVYALCVREASTYTRDHLSTQEDCLQVCFISLENALRSFEPGYRLFSTHACQRIRCDLLQFLKGNQLVKLPSSVSLCDAWVSVPMLRSATFEMDFQESAKEPMYFIDTDLQNVNAKTRYAKHEEAVYYEQQVIDFEYW